MTQATFSIASSDFDMAMFEKIKSFIQGQNAEVFIRIKTKETAAEAKKRIDAAIEDVENQMNVVSFSAEEFEELSQKLRL